MHDTCSYMYSASGNLFKLKFDFEKKSQNLSIWSSFNIFHLSVKECKSHKWDNGLYHLILKILDSSNTISLKIGWFYNL